MFPIVEHSERSKLLETDTQVSHRIRTARARFPKQTPDAVVLMDLFVDFVFPSGDAPVGRHQSSQLETKNHSN